MVESVCIACVIFDPPNLSLILSHKKNIPNLLDIPKRVRHEIWYLEKAQTQFSVTVLTRVMVDIRAILELSFSLPLSQVWRNAPWYYPYNRFDRGRNYEINEQLQRCAGSAWKALKTLLLKPNTGWTMAHAVLIHALLSAQFPMLPCSWIFDDVSIWYKYASGFLILISPQNGADQARVSH